MKKHMPFIWLALQSAFKTIQENPPWATTCWLPVPQSQHEDNTHHVSPNPPLFNQEHWSTESNGGGGNLSRWFSRTTESSFQKKMEQYFPAQDLTLVCFLPNLCACWHHFLLNSKSLFHTRKESAPGILCSRQNKSLLSLPVIGVGGVELPKTRSCKRLLQIYKVCSQKYVSLDSSSYLSSFD